MLMPLGFFHSQPPVTSTCRGANPKAILAAGGIEGLVDLNAIAGTVDACPGGIAHDDAPAFK
jgi:hypothetical protein